LGECFLATIAGIQLIVGHFEPNLALTVASSLVITLVMWWLYFENTNFEIMNTTRGIFFWGYIHILIFATLAAVGVGFAVMNDLLHGHGSISLAIGAPLWLYHSHYL
jgi:low temperature requirement protein LtrA